MRQRIAPRDLVKRFSRSRLRFLTGFYRLDHTFEQLDGLGFLGQSDDRFLPVRGVAVTAGTAASGLARNVDGVDAGNLDAEDLLDSLADLDLVGGVFKKVAYALPFVHAVEAERAVLSGNFSDILPHLLWVLGYSAAALTAAVLFFLRQMKKQ